MREARRGAVAHSPYRGTPRRPSPFAPSGQTPPTPRPPVILADSELHYLRNPADIVRLIELHQAPDHAAVVADVDARLGTAGRLFSMHHTAYYRPPHQLVWCPRAVANHRPDLYSTYYALVNQIDALYRCTHPRALELLDYLLPLSVVVELRATFTDAAIAAEPECRLHWPDRVCPFSLESLPDLSLLLHYAAFWEDRPEVPFRDPAILKLLEILGKAMPYACKGRSLADIVAATFQHQPVPDTHGRRADRNARLVTMRYASEAARRTPHTAAAPPPPPEGGLVYECVTRMLVAALLGLYPHCRQRAHLLVRRRVYRWFYVEAPTPARVAALITRNNVLDYVIREYVYGMVCWTVPAVADTMRRLYYWRAMCRNTFGAMDEVRVLVSAQHRSERCSMHSNALAHRLGIDREQCFFRQHADERTYTRHYHDWAPGESWLRAASVFLRQASTSNLSYTPRPKRESFMTEVYERLNRIDDCHLPRLARRGLQHQWLAQPAPTPDVLRLVRARVRATSPHAPPHYDWLVLEPFRLSVHALLLMRNAQRLYEAETVRSAPRLTLLDIISLSRWDYELLREYFRAAYRHQSLRLFRMDARDTARQLDRYQRLYALGLVGEREQLQTEQIRRQFARRADEVHQRMRLWAAHARHPHRLAEALVAACTTHDIFDWPTLVDAVGRIAQLVRDERETADAATRALRTRHADELRALLDTFGGNARDPDYLGARAEMLRQHRLELPPPPPAVSFEAQQSADIRHAMRRLLADLRAATGFTAHEWTALVTHDRELPEPVRDALLPQLHRVAALLVGETAECMRAESGALTLALCGTPQRAEALLDAPVHMPDNDRGAGAALQHLWRTGEPPPPAATAIVIQNAPSDDRLARYTLSALALCVLRQRHPAGAVLLRSPDACADLLTPEWLPLAARVHRLLHEHTEPHTYWLLALAADLWQELSDPRVFTFYEALMSDTPAPPAAPRVADSLLHDVGASAPPAQHRLGARMTEALAAAGISLDLRQNNILAALDTDAGDRALAAVDRDELHRCMSQGAGIYHVCTSCSKLKTVTIHPGQPTRAALKSSTLVQEEICVDLATRRSYCMGSGMRGSARARTVNKVAGGVSTGDLLAAQADGSADALGLRLLGEFSDTEDDGIELHQAMNPNNTNRPAQTREKEARKASKHLRDAMASLRCMRTPLQPLNMIGHVLQTPRGLHLQCPECLTMCFYSRELWRTGRLSCGCLRERAPPPPPRPLFCALCEEPCPADAHRHWVLNDCFAIDPDTGAPSQREIEPILERLPFCARHPNDHRGEDWQPLPLSLFRRAQARGWLSRTVGSTRVHVEEYKGREQRISFKRYCYSVPDPPDPPAIATLIGTISPSALYRKMQQQHRFMAGAVRLDSTRATDTADLARHHRKRASATVERVRKRMRENS